MPEVYSHICYPDYAPVGLRSTSVSDSDSGSIPLPDVLSWQSYEKVVKEIYQALGRAKGVVIECWGGACRVKGVSGQSHQIDVLTKHSDGIHEYRTAISCKYWNRKVGLPNVRDWAQVIDDTKLNKGVIVSKQGFTGPAKKYAAAMNIGLVELRQPADRDWDGYIREVQLNLVIEHPPLIYGVKLEISGQGPNDSDLCVDQSSWNLAYDEMLFQIPGREAVTLQQLVYEKWHENDEEGEQIIRFSPGSICLIPYWPEYPAHGREIISMSFKLQRGPVHRENIVIPLDNYVYMIMTNIFDDRCFVIGSDGQIKESTD